VYKDLSHLRTPKKMLLTTAQQRQQFKTASGKAARKGIIEKTLMKKRIPLAITNQDVL
jgi:hypothetical protein